MLYLKHEKHYEKEKKSVRKIILIYGYQGKYKGKKLYKKYKGK